MSVEPPSWLFGNIWMLTRPLVRLATACAASFKRMVLGCVSSDSWPNFRLKSAVCARAGWTNGAAAAVSAETLKARLVMMLVMANPLCSRNPFVRLLKKAGAEPRHRGDHEQADDQCDEIADDRL